MEARISGHTKLFALIGSPVGHSGSPAMYNYSFERTGIDAAYLAFDIPLENVKEGVAALDGAQEIAIFNRADEFYANGEKTVEKLCTAVPSCKVSIQPLEDAHALSQAVEGCDILVNATKVGMKPLNGQSLVDASLLRKDLVVADTVYNPRKTLLIEQAEAAGCTAIGGIGMLLWQGVAAFRLFTGKEMPAQEVLEKFFS